MDTITKPVARILYGLPFAVFGIRHFINGGMMTGMVWLPGGIFWVYLTGLALIGAGISFTINKYANLAAWGLAIFLFFTAFTVHLPGAISGTQANITGMLKDIMLLGAALHFAGVFTREQF